MPISNLTKHAAVDVPMLDASGREVVVALVKATFEVRPDGRLVPVDDPSPIRVADVPRDPDNMRSSLLYPSELGPAKVGTDVVIIGDAVSKTPVTVLDVAVKVRERMAPLRVHGERMFYKSFTGVAIGRAAAFETKPITYERAYGGASEDWTVIEERNPSGIGIAKQNSDLVDHPAPQIEHPAHPYTGPGDAPEPMGFGAIMTHWAPRKGYVGTYDELWIKTRLPLPPLDFNPRFWNVAHPTLQFDVPLTAGDPISLVGMTLERFAFVLPSFPVRILGRFDGRAPLDARPVIDTVLIEPTRRRVEIVARQAFAIGRRREVLREIVVEMDP